MKPDFEKLLKSKTFYTGGGVLAYGLYLLTQGDVENGVLYAAIGLVAAFLRDGVAKLERKLEEEA